MHPVGRDARFSARLKKRDDLKETIFSDQSWAWEGRGPSLPLVKRSGLPLMPCESAHEKPASDAPRPCVPLHC